MDDQQIHDHDRGLSFDLGRLMGRRRVLGLFAAAGAGVVALAACGSDEDTTSGAAGSADTSGAATSETEAATTEAATSDASCTVIPGETAGPYPGDGSNGANILNESGVVRGDIRSSIGSASGVAEGVPLTITLTVVDNAAGCTPLAGAAVYLWHCDRDGLYSMYSQGVEDENYLRGVQETDAAGTVTFTSIFPAAYRGRWPHIHFEVYPSVDAATSASGILATSQLALPEAVCNAVYATEGYEQSMTNMPATTLANDNVFSDDGAAHQLATVTGDVSAGYTATLTVPV